MTDYMLFIGFWSLVAVGLNIGLVRARAKSQEPDIWGIFIIALYFFLLPSNIGIGGRIIFQIALSSGLIFILLARGWERSKMS